MSQPRGVHATTEEGQPWSRHDEGCGAFTPQPRYAERTQQHQPRPTPPNVATAKRQFRATDTYSHQRTKRRDTSPSCTSTCKSKPAPTGDEQPGRPVRPPLVPRGFSESTRSRDHFTDREAGGLVCVLPHLLSHTARYSFPGNGTGTTPPCLRVVRRTTVSEPGYGAVHPGGRHVAGKPGGQTDTFRAWRGRRRRRVDSDCAGELTRPRRRACADFCPRTRVTSVA